MCQLRRAKAARLLLRRQLIFAGRLDLRHAVHHLHKRGDGYASKVGRSPLVLRARAQGAACGGVGVRTGTVGLSLIMLLESFCWSLVQPLALRGGGRHLVPWRHLDYY